MEASTAMANKYARYNSTSSNNCCDCDRYDDYALNEIDNILNGNSGCNSCQNSCRPCHDHCGCTCNPCDCDPCDCCDPYPPCQDPCDPCGCDCDPCNPCDPCYPCDDECDPCDCCDPCTPCCDPCDCCNPCQDSCCTPCRPCNPCCNTCDDMCHNQCDNDAADSDDSWYDVPKRPQRPSPCCCTPSEERCQKCYELAKYIQHLDFALWEVTLYLDMHPCDCRALRYYHRIKCELTRARDVYERNCMPISNCGNENQYEWEWAQGPWPWEGE